MEQQELKFIPFHSIKDADWHKAWALYESAFPANECWGEEQYIAAFANDPAFVADGIWLGEEFVGLIFYWDTGRYCYVEHFAIDPRYRNQHLGSRVMQAMIRRYPHLVLEIEEPVDELTTRRSHFYMRQGLVLNPEYEYIHPSYRPPFEHFPLVLMSYPDHLSREEAAHIADFTREHVLRIYSDHENPTLPYIPL